MNKFEVWCSELDHVSHADVHSIQHNSNKRMHTHTHFVKSDRSATTDHAFCWTGFLTYWRETWNKGWSLAAVISLSLTPQWPSHCWTLKRLLFLVSMLHSCSQKRKSVTARWLKPMGSGPSKGAFTVQVRSHCAMWNGKSHWRLHQSVASCAAQMLSCNRAMVQKRPAGSVPSSQTVAH